MNGKRFDNQEQDSKHPFTTILEWSYVGKHKNEISFNSPIILINLDELDPDICIRSGQISEIVLRAYEEAKKNYESSSEYEGWVKNGTYKRKICVVDPIDGANITFEVRMQRYLNKNEGRTHAFYGGIYMPYFPLLICQALLILGQKAASEFHTDQECNESDKLTLREHCFSWHISIQHYYTLFRIVKERILCMGNATRNEVKELLINIHYAPNA